MLKRAREMALLTIACLTACSLSACGVRTDKAAGDSYYAAAGSMESTPVIEYTLPQFTANVAVDRLGYQPQGVKEASVKGQKLPPGFRLVNADTGETVYEGRLDKVEYRTDAELYVGVARFDAYKEPGTYYVECDGIGRSYPFSIVQDIYIQLFEETYDRIIESCREQTVTVSEATALLTAYEWYPELFHDENEDEIPDVLQVLLTWIDRQDYSEEESPEGTALKAALLAKFSYLYQEYDREFATACLQRASTLYRETQKIISKDAENFFALTELYRASGLWSYRKQIVDYKTYFENSTYLEETEYLYGAMTYMMTRQKVDVELCELFIQKMMDRGESLLRNYEEVTDPIAAKNNGVQDILNRSTDVLFVNCVLKSYQYHNLLLDFVHYLGGKNLQSAIFYPGENQEEGYILLLAQLAALEMEEE